MGEEKREARVRLVNVFGALLYYCARMVFSSFHFSLYRPNCLRKNSNSLLSALCVRIYLSLQYSFVNGCVSLYAY